MPSFVIGVALPYFLRLPDGEYRTSGKGEAVQITTSAHPDGIHSHSLTRSHFTTPDTDDLDEILKQRIKSCDQLLLRINRLLRWYRSVSRQADITELTRAQASPFLFSASGTSVNDEWYRPLLYEEEGAQQTELPDDQLELAVRQGLIGGDDPDVADLFLLDAERALHQGRFRETILFCWSTIDSSFNRKYDALVDHVLADEWKDARNFFKGLDFKLRNKMSAGMFLIANRSLFHEPGDFWTRLSASYDKRNKIIHSGMNASEDEAKQALDIAKKIVRIMAEIQIAKSTA